MCGIVGYVGKGSAVKPIIDGLKSLEYRGYDSAGITAISQGGPITAKQVGRVEGLETAVADKKEFTSTHIAIGHTRWATHGSPTISNAHPHFNSSHDIYVVHNGIIENYEQIRQRLRAEGYEFATETDTEVIPQLIDYYRKQLKDFYKAFKATLQDLKGAYAIAALQAEDPDTIYAARLSSPLIIGIGENENFLASDPMAIMEHTKKVIYLNDYEVAVITQNDVKLHNIKHDIDVKRQAEQLDFDIQSALLGDYPHFMLKEIYEAPQTVQSASRGRIRAETNTVKLGGLESVAEQLSYIDRIVIVACGTSYYAGLVGEYLIEEIAGIPVEVQLASEFKYRNEPFSRSTALLAISQSGETADTIAALKKVEGYGVLRLGIVNAVGSTIARMTDAGVYCHAGPEQSVASTKAFIAQVTVLAEIALYLNRGRNKLYKPVLQELAAMPDKILEVLEQDAKIKKIAKKYSHNRDFLYIGRGYSYPCALEGALKLKEISYIHAEGYAAGEMKHGPLAMIDKKFPAFAINPKGPMRSKTYSNIQEIRARGGPVVAIATKGDSQIKKLAQDLIFIPDSVEQLQPLLMAVALQLFAYHVAVDKGCDIDRPRNLAKSVTVE
jgi:glucosamine--fructose-6-phosphate aminotransferase (isomerizing)